MTEKKKFYEKPAIEVFELNQKPVLLAGSEQVNATMDGTWTEQDI